MSVGVDLNEFLISIAESFNHPISIEERVFALVDDCPRRSRPEEFHRVVLISFDESLGDCTANLRSRLFPYKARPLPTAEMNQSSDFDESIDVSMWLWLIVRKVVATLNSSSGQTSLVEGQRSLCIVLENTIKIYIQQVIQFQRGCDCRTRGTGWRSSGIDRLHLWYLHLHFSSFLSPLLCGTTSIRQCAVRQHQTLKPQFIL